MVITIDPHLRTPFAHHVSVGLDRVFAAGFTLSTRFVYVRGFDQVGIIEYNPVTNPATGGRPFDVNGVPGTSAPVSQYTSWSETWYRGLTVSAHKRFGRQSEVLLLYTFSKAEDLATDYAFSQPQDNGLGRNPADPKGLPLGFNPMLERGPSLQDERHRFVLSGMYELPWRMTVSGIGTIGSGRPFNIVAGTDLNHDGDILLDRPRLADGSSLGRNAGLLPRTSTVDLRISRRIALGGRANLEMMVEMFNLFNTTNYTQVNDVCGPSYPSCASDFGQFTKAAPPFQAQLAARVLF